MLKIDLEEKTNEWVPVSSKGKTGLERVTSIGCGVMLVKRHVFEKIERPWFWFENLKNHKLLGEDVYFCVKAHDFGFETWVDHDLSNEIGHVGSYTYGWHDIQE
jgi:hypothetical protein